MRTGEGQGLMLLETNSKEEQERKAKTDPGLEIHQGQGDVLD